MTPVDTSAEGLKTETWGWAQGCLYAVLLFLLISVTYILTVIMFQMISQTETASFQLLSVPLIFSVKISTLQINL
jgi:hypothetical protein